MIGSHISHLPPGAEKAAEAVAAVSLAQLALRWKIMTDLAKSAVRRLEKVHSYAEDPLAHAKFYVVLWALKKLPHVHTSLIRKALQNLEDICLYFESQAEREAS